MAEGGRIGSLIGAGEGESDGEAGLGGGSALPEAVALDHAGASEEAKAYLRDARRMIGVQMEHLHEQRTVLLSHLKLRRLSDRLRIGTQIFLILIATFIGVALLVMLNDAFAARSVVVDAFKAPAALTGRGVTGEVVATGVLDGLQRLSDATRSRTKGLSATNAWSSDVKIEVPETGVSIGEIDRLLRQRLGHDVHIGGDLIQTETGGLALTVRGDAIPAQTFEGSAGDLAKLTGQAAEYLYGRSQPIQFATYLVNRNRNADALAFLPGAVARASDDLSRATLVKWWGAAYSGLNQPGPATAKFRLAMALNPGNWNAWGDLVASLPSEEARWRESQKFMAAVKAAPKAKRPELRLMANAAQTLWDLPQIVSAENEDATHNGGAGASSVILGPALADTYGVMHDQTSAARYMAQSDPDDSTTKAERDLLLGYAALDQGDFAAAEPPLEAFWKAWLADSNLEYVYPDNPCLAGLAFGMTGRMAQAQMVFKRIGVWSRCYAAQGEILEHAGDLAGANRIWAQGLSLEPDPAHVYLARGVSETRRGDVAHAAVDLAAANHSAPHWADPLKAWGDLLAREGRWREALAKYDQSLKYAPAWPQLRQARAIAASRALAG